MKCTRQHIESSSGQGKLPPFLHPYVYSEKDFFKNLCWIGSISLLSLIFLSALLGFVCHHRVSSRALVRLASLYGYPSSTSVRKKC